MSEARAIARDLEQLAARLAELARRIEALQADGADSIEVAPSRLLSCAEVVERTGLPRGAVYALGRRGEAGAVRTGLRSIRFSEGELTKWLRQGGAR